MDIDDPELRPVKILLWSLAAALLRGDETAAELLAADAPEPAMTAVAAESLAEVLKIHALVADIPPERLQGWVGQLLATLVAGPGPDLPITGSTLPQPDWLPST